MNSLAAPALIAVAVLVAAAIAFVLGKRMKPAPARESDAGKKQILAAAEAEADAIKRQAALDARETIAKNRMQVESELRARRQELDRQIADATANLRNLERRDREMTAAKEDVARKEREIAGREAAAEAAARQASAQAAEARVRLEAAAGLSAGEARKALEAEVLGEARLAAAADVKRIEDEARAEALNKSHMILGAAIQRYASDYVTERTVSVVPLPSDDMKGRLIGREGRNIRALEAATGIDLIIDDTPEAVVISCFHPVRREIARLALTRLIADGRIHPTRIEEMVEKATQEIEQQCQTAGEQAAFDLGIPNLHPELLRLLGTLKFRSSNAQNLLQHSIEVGFFAGIMAGELGLPVKAARRAGLLHDIGKAVDQEAEGPHAVVGAATARKFGEPAGICHAIEAHHGNVAATDALDHIIDAANVLSGQRPGARREMMESYVQRLTNLEAIATGFAGVQKAFAIQAGREVRVMVENSKITDDETRLLCKNIARKVEAELSYPGQVRVAVIRETRATDYAK